MGKTKKIAERIANLGDKSTEKCKRVITTYEDREGYECDGTNRGAFRVVGKVL